MHLISFPHGISHVEVVIHCRTMDCAAYQCVVAISHQCICTFTDCSWYLLNVRLTKWD